MHDATHRAPTASLPRETARWVGPFLLTVLIAVLAVHVVGVLRDFVVAIRYPYELDYGEGIVWQQAALIPGPRMYGVGQGLPFIVFHYPPLFHLLARALAGFMPDLLSAGRLVSAISTVAIAPLVAGLVLFASRPSADGRPDMRIGIAIAAGLLALSLHAVRSWGMVMRVDMVSIALSLAGVLVACWSDGRMRGTTCALLLCVASVYCKQTELPAAAAIFFVVLLRRPRVAIGAGAVALTAGLAVLGLLQWLTNGGFLQNIVADNVNRFGLRHAAYVLVTEFMSLPFMALILVAAWIILRGMVVSATGGMVAPAPGSPLRRLQALAQLRRSLADRATAARAMVLLHFAFASLMLFTIFKSGANYNYLIEWLCVGCVLIGVLLSDLVAVGKHFSKIAAPLILCVLMLPIRQLTDRFPQAIVESQAALVQRIAHADKPVASENMTLLMRAGKPVIFEPAIATELASRGKWDEKPLVDMVKSGGFAFMIYSDDSLGPTPRRSPAVDAAMRLAYPRVEHVGRRLYVHLPAK